MANKSQSEWRCFIIYCITTTRNARVQFISIKTLWNSLSCRVFLRGRIMMTFGNVNEFLLRRSSATTAQTLWTDELQYKYSWSRSVFPKMFSINKPLRLFFTSRSNTTYVSEGKTKCQWKREEIKQILPIAEEKFPWYFELRLEILAILQSLYYFITQFLAETIVLLCGILTGKHL
jgi:hypothetical protein